MQIYTARQPIFNSSGQVVAYELLFRESKKNCFPSHVSPDVATAKLLVNSYLSLGLEQVTEGKPALINFPKGMLKDHLLHMVPYKNIIVEVLETVEPNDDNFELLRALFHRGFKLALDDFVYTPEWERFFPFIKLIKIDILETPYREVAPLLPLFRQHKIKLLAEKVETYEQFHQGQAHGYDYYQGYFFCKPEVLEGKDIENQHHFLMSIYGEVMKPEFSYKRVERFFEHDVGLTFKLLRFVNSSLFQHSQEIISIKQAISFLGEIQIRKFVSLIVMSQMSPDKPSELIKTTILRARYCELLARAMRLNQLLDAAFLTGLFSTIDAILDISMQEVMNSLPLAKDIKQALLAQEGELAICLGASDAMIRGKWNKASELLAQYAIEDSYLISCYYDALSWCQTFESSIQPTTDTKKAP